MSDWLTQVEETMAGAPAGERLRRLRLACLLAEPDALGPWLRTMLGSADERLMRELLTRLATLNPESALDWLNEVARSGDEERLARIRPALESLPLLYLLFTKLDAFDSPDCREAHHFIDKIRPWVGPAMLFHILRRLYRADRTEFRSLRSLLDAIPADGILPALDGLKHCGDPEFLLSAVLYLKSIDDNKRAVQFLEAFSRLEYGSGMTDALKQLDQDLRQKRRPAGEKLVAVVTSSAVVARAFSRAGEGLASVEHLSETMLPVLRNQLTATNPELLVIDKSALQGEGLQFALTLMKDGYRKPLIFAADFLSAHQKDQLVAGGIREFLQIPFTIDEAAARIAAVLERVEKDAVVRKAQQTLPAGSILCREGDPGDCCYVIQKGRVKIWRHDDAGRELLLATLGAGEIFGEMAIIDKSPRSAHVTVVEDCELLRIAEENFEKVLSSNPPFALKMIRILVKRLRSATDRLRELEGRV